MSEEQEMEGRKADPRAKTGLEIIYARDRVNDDLTGVAKRVLTKELRERNWIGQAEDVGIRPRTWASVGISMPMRIERHQLGRNRNEPGDGFRYVFRSGTAGTGGRAEWFEVIEVFEGVEAKDVEAFMRIDNGGEAGFDFDADKFVRGLDMGTPCRAAQQRAADKVIAEVGRKMNKGSYEGMWQTHGYGTLIVGLPLWFATAPANPLRVENSIDDFVTRVDIGLQPYARRLKKKACPFWRIVVVWSGSLESMREWSSNARFDIYDDPAYRRMGGLPISHELKFDLFLKILSAQEAVRPGEERAGGLRKYVSVARPEKKGKDTLVRLPPAVDALKRSLDEFGKQNREKLPDRVKWRAKRWILEVLCFLRVYGPAGLERWIVARLSPRRRIARLAMRRRSIRLYQASRRRRGKSGEAGGQTRGGSR